MGTAAVRGGNGRWGVLAAVVVAGVLGWGFAAYAGDVYHREIGGPLQHCAKVGSLAGPAVAAAVMAPLLSTAAAVAAGWVAARSSRSPLLLVAGGVLAVAAGLFAVGEVFNAVNVLSGPHTMGNTCE
ncbi:hypothetical protein [Streptomyces sp. CB01881]|uniref:hypothetical protein n=1 Tax=Streptomyces sp. CB01881 TaxID=2078691 RepID=UPI000CDBB9D7|nr:hypothetical protein [Streptomyces sp. CB01881]AUY50143.1 hypothetical protein C2142_15795 [Streptomyces sp. CB01881]TYC73536.1 hypothetical protein EH183_15775 [Streptomyces sp. CB01881]